MKRIKIVPKSSIRYCGYYRLMWLFWFEKAVWHELYFPKI